MWMWEGSDAIAENNTGSSVNGGNCTVQHGLPGPGGDDWYSHLLAFLPKPLPKPPAFASPGFLRVVLSRLVVGRNLVLGFYEDQSAHPVCEPVGLDQLRVDEITFQQDR